MKIDIGNNKNKDMLFIKPELFKNVTFIFANYKNDYLVFILSIIKYDENYIRIEPRYFDNDMMNEFLNKTKLKNIYNNILNIIKTSKNYTDLMQQIQTLVSKNKIEIDTFDRKEIEDDYYMNWTDYTMSDLYLNEPEGIGINEKAIKNNIDTYNKENPNDSKINENTET